HPLNRGFDFFFGHLGGGHNYFPESLNIQDSYSAENENQSYKTWILKNHTPIQTKKYLTDEFSDEAVSFIENSQKKPFFLYLSYNAPHTPLQASEKYLKRFPNLQGKRKTYAAMVSAVDDGVGMVLDQLEKLNLDENTLVFFLSDNGGPETKNGSNNGPLRGMKSSVYEGGFRVPYAVQWKGNIQPGIYHEPVSSLDIYATIAALSKAPIKKKKPLDGTNLIPFLNATQKGKPHENIYLRKFDGKFHTIRNNNLKLVINGKTSKKELYNLKDDIGETKNIANKHPKDVERLSQLSQEWDSHLIDPIFLGLIHTKEWQKKLQRKNKKN
ncbi:MAG: sulfatase-like hydrolase/transferase, partial [Flavicella sp.]|nr:sulfatase-like hydrolase/transferase [Flavicella sp.]